MTALDDACGAMQADPDDVLARLRYYEVVSESELVLWLEAEPQAGGALVPAVFETADGRLALAFDSEARLAGFTGGPVSYAALPGRTLVGLLAEQGVGLGINLGVAGAEFLMPAEALGWLARTLRDLPRTGAGRPETLAPPAMPQDLVAALDRKLARAAGLAAFALLVRVTWPGGRAGHLLALVDAAPGAETVLARAIGEALTFSGHAAGDLDIVFLDAGTPLVARIARHALRFDLPAPAPAEPADADCAAAPGSDPARPPRLR